jgi:hypothetical protein
MSGVGSRPRSWNTAAAAICHRAARDFFKRARLAICFVCGVSASSRRRFAVSGDMVIQKSPVPGLLIIALGLVLSTAIAARSWVSVRLHRDHSIEATGSAKRTIVSDLIEWTGTIRTENSDRSVAARALKDHMSRTLAYLKKAGVADVEVEVSSAYTEEDIETEYRGSGETRIEKKVFKGYKLSQSVSIKSKDVPKINKVSREVTQLVEDGVPIESADPSFHYTQLGALKVEMLAEAARDCRQRAERILQYAGGATLGKLRRADMGVININPANSTEISAEGNNDTTSMDKDILTIVHCSFDLERG